MPGPRKKRARPGFWVRAGVRDENRQALKTRSCIAGPGKKSPGSENPVLEINEPGDSRICQALKIFKFLFSISQMLEQQQRNQSKHPLQVRSKIMVSNSKVQIFVMKNFNQPIPPTQTKISQYLKIVFSMDD